jgi:WD40 repeat protein
MMIPKSGGSFRNILEFYFPFFHNKGIFTNLILIIFFHCASAQQQIFHPNNDGHLGKLAALTADPSGQYTATASQDNTIRIYRQSNGEPLKTLFLPFNNYNNKSINKSRIHSLSFYPDGKTLVCAGNLGNIAQNSYTVYFFDVLNGTITDSISGLKDVPYKIIISEKSHHIAITFSNGRIDVYNKKTLIFSDHSNSIASRPVFDTVGNLYTLSLSGHLMVFKYPDYRQTIKQKLETGEISHIFTVNRNGSQLAAGSTEVNLPIKSYLLSSQFTSGTPMNIPDKDESMVSSAAFSHCGKYLNVGVNIFDVAGALKGGGSPYIYQWDMSKPQLPPKKFALPIGIMPWELIPLANGNILYSDAAHGWGMVDASGNEVFWKQPSVFSFDGQDNHLAISYDGSIVGFTRQRDGNDPIYFSIRMGLIEDAMMLKTPKKTPINIERLENGLKDFAMQPGESVVTFCISWDNNYITVATNYRIICIDADGNITWISHMPADVKAVNISGNGHFVVAALSDGTLRWYQMKTGNEIMALFISVKDSSHWVMWSPTHQWKTSSQGGHLCGWLETDNMGNTIYTARYSTSSTVTPIDFYTLLKP